MAGSDAQRDSAVESSTGEPGPLSRLLQELADASGKDALDAWENEVAPGDRLGRFEIRQEVGRGGFGAVYEAFDTELNRIVAVKTLRLSRPRRDLSSDWIKKEAEAVARLDHPCIVTLFDVGTCDSGPYLVMELLRGKTLAQRIAEGPIPEGEALRIAEEMAKGLAHAHQRGVLHRDLKPSNVFLCDDSRVKLLDFGLAHLLGTEGVSGAGTPAYMAPEQTRGGEVDQRADVYAAGRVLGDMLGRRRPRVLERAIALATSADPAARPRDGQAWLDLLQTARHAIERPARIRRVAVLAGLGVVLGGLVVGVAVRWAPRPVADAPGKPSIAVLPFADLSPNHDQEYFSDGISEEILTALSGVKGLRVPGRTSSFYFKGRNVEPGEIARKLGVAHLLEGSVRRSGNKVRISAEVVRANDGDRVWSKSFDRDLADIFAVQDEIARTVADALRVKLVPGEDLEGSWTRTGKPEAYNQLLLGRDFLRRGTPEDYRRALDAYERALALDPGYAAAWAGVADAASSVVGSGQDDPGLHSKAVVAADKAVALAPDHPNSYGTRAGVRLGLFDWVGAVADLDRVLALRPADVGARWARSFYMGDAAGPVAGAIPHLRATADGDPLNADAWVGLAFGHMVEGDLPRARQALARALEIAPGHISATRWMCACLIAEGRPREALDLTGPSPLEWLRLTCTALAQEDLGNPREATAALDALVARHGSIAAAQIAEVYAWRGDRDRAFEWLDRAVAQRDMGLLNAWFDPLLRKLHDDPRWKGFLRRMTVAGGARLLEARTHEGTAPPSIAVLPFADMSPKHDQEYFADGVAEEIRNALAQVDGLKVIGRTSSFSFKGKSDDLKTIGQKLGVANVLEGSLRRDGNTVRITAQLIRVADETHLWSESYDRKAVAIFKVQEEIARSVVGALKVKLLPENRAAPEARALDPEAHRLFLLGRSLVFEGTEESNRRAIAVLDSAIAIDPGMGQAHAWVAIAAWNASQATSGDERRGFLRRQRAEADLAVATAPHLSTAYAARGSVRMTHDWDWDGARRDIEQALALDPHDQFALDQKANLESALGRFPEALYLGRRAVELDPLNEEATLNLGWFQLGVGDLAEARRMARRALEIHPGSNLARAILAHADLREGDARAALEGFERIRAEGKMRGLPGVAAAAYSLGKEEQSLAVLTELERQAGDQPFLIGSVHAWRGDKDEAFRWLDKARREHDVRMMMVKWWPLLGPIRGDPRYTALLKKLNLPVE